ncbi:dienelactone hydrolase family protein [Actinomyces haliotis]|uniref:dienelactone hydrolase family protein n=1 Tax=Actinomyces haliotis TaxID=1280843 RepID=UPI00188EC345|nr:dienelactone hydrolase family protein [Actinomyces haliotis]
MATIVLFHHVLGLTDGVTAFAQALRDAGHDVLTPDLFEGRTFTDLPAGLAHAGEIGDDELLARAEHACADLPADVVYGGFSLGVMPAEHLLLTRPGAAGGLLLHSFIEPAQLEGSWPEDCPVSLFAMDADPFLVEDGDLDAARSWQPAHPNLGIHLYPGAGHLFMEPGSRDYDPAVTSGVVDDVLAFLAALPQPGAEAEGAR